MALVAPGAHTGTVFLAMRMLLAITKYPALIKRFKEGTANGGWLQVSEFLSGFEVGIYFF